MPAAARPAPPGFVLDADGVASEVDGLDECGEASRKDAQRALTDTLLHLLLETIPRR